MMIIIIFLSPILIPLIWGQKWIQAVPLVQVLAILGILQSLVSPVGQLMKALNQPGWLLNWSVFVTVVVSIFILVGNSYHGVIGVTYGITTAYFIGVIINLFIVRKLVQISAVQYLSALVPSFLASLLMGFLMYWIWNSKVFLYETKIFVGVFLGLLLYLLCLLLFDKPFVMNIYKRISQSLTYFAINPK